MNDLVPYHQQWCQNVPRSGRIPTIGGYVILVVGLFGFGAWASTAPIDGAVLTPGNFVATSQNKIIQHLEGGIIDEILVREGEAVKAGQTLIRLAGTDARADLARLEVRRAQLLAADSRLLAEAEDREVLAFPDALSRDLELPAISSFIAGERAIFQARRNKLASDVSILERTALSFKHRMTGDTAKLEATRAQIGYIAEEAKGKGQLYEQGLLRKTEFLALERARANLEGEAKRLEADIADSGERVAATSHQIERARNVAVETAVEERKTVAGELKDIHERITQAKSVLSRLEINAPVDGTVVKLNYHTAGGVIRPGNDILALLPAGDELIIEVTVRPQDIDNVKQGQLALVRLTALNQRVTPMIPGTVIYVSADALPSERHQKTDNVYIARIRLDYEHVKDVEGFVPTPGMPTEVYIKTGERTFFEYLMAPIRDTMSRAFRES